ncbi:MAG: hypothetical protein M1546_22720 [Chloroflexi bacterium]|nr:hypothetical protein [Chloroflexota bacterium]
MEIADLPDLIARLPRDQRARFERIFDVQLEHGHLVLPDSMREWTVHRFGSPQDVEHQAIVRVTNTHTWEGAIFNPLRGRRPMLTRSTTHTAPVEDIFADPARNTAADTFGRVRGAHCITTSNIARWDAHCSVLIFDQADPLAFTREHLRDYFRTTVQWAERAHQDDSSARYLIWTWNGGTAGGASVPHAHAQLGLARHKHYAMVEGLRRAALAYRSRYGTTYFDDLLAVHDDAGLGFHAAGQRGFVSLTAVRAKDTWIMGQAFDDTLADALHHVLRAYVDHAGMRGFDVAVLMPPLFPAAQQPGTFGAPGAEDWAGFPVIARVVDRGHPDALSSDVGAMDIFAQRVIPDDPYLAQATLARSIPAQSPAW